jgi:hypothetical protein
MSESRGTRMKRIKRTNVVTLWALALALGLGYQTRIASAVNVGYRSAIIFGNAAATWAGATFGSTSADHGIYWNSADGLPHVHTTTTEYAIPQTSVALAGGYATADNAGTPLTQRATINFTGSGVSCVDNAGASRTDCSISRCPPGYVCVTEPPYNAVGNCSTNDTTAIQSAITAAGAGGRVWFPTTPGGSCYLVTSTLTTPNFTTLEGPGYFLGTGIPAPVQIKFTTASSTLIAAGTNINVKNLFLEGPGTGTGIATTSHIQVKDCQIDNWAIGLSLTNTFYGTVEGTDFHADAIGIQTTGVYNLKLIRDFFRLVPTAVNVTDRVAELTMFGCSVEGFSTNGAIIPGANSLVNVIETYFESSTVGAGGTGIKNNGSQNTFLLEGNQVYLTEVSKWFDGNGQDKTTLVSRANKFIAAVGSTVTPTAYVLGINATGGGVDIGPDDWTGVLKVGSVYASGGVTAGYLRTIGTTGILTETPAAASTIDVGAGGAVKAQHFLSKGSVPSISASTGAGTGGAASLIAGSDTSGLIQVVTGTSPAANAAIAILTYNQTFGAAGQGRPVIVPGNAAAAALSGATQVYSDSVNQDQTQFRLWSGSSALAASTTYKWWYHVLQ